MTNASLTSTPQPPRQTTPTTLTPPTSSNFDDPSAVSRAPKVLSTLNDDGSRKWLRPRPMSGRFLTARRAVAWALILLFTILPYTTINGRPTLLLDVAARRFHLLGATFYPTDTLLLAFFMVGVFLFVFLITALFGRVWCGWACPQTVYLEFVYRPIERLFEGTPGRAAPGLLARLPLASFWKNLLYLLVSLILANTFLAYFVGVDRLFLWITRPPSQHPVGFTIVLAVTALMLFDFGFFREQLCIVACPYGRFQSVMLDRNSLIVTYDRPRGEPRGRARRSSKTPDLALPIADPATGPSTGHCVDCHLCVTTCPTGIDIRNGLQMECVGCAQCIDACDAVMDKLSRPRGLIRYSSQAALASPSQSPTHPFLRPRVVIYSVMLCLIATLFTITLMARGPADVRILRGMGAPFIVIGEKEIANQIRIKITNRSDHRATYEAHALAAEGARVQAEGFPVAIEPGAMVTTPALLIATRSAFTRGKCPLLVRVTGPAGFTSDSPFTLQGPGADHHAQPKSAPRDHPDHHDPLKDHS